LENSLQEKSMYRKWIKRLLDIIISGAGLLISPASDPVDPGTVQAGVSGIVYPGKTGQEGKDL